MLDKKIPNGFLSSCPFPGYDPDRVDKNQPISSVIYSKTIQTAAIREEYEGETDAYENSELVGYTFERNPVLWPNRNPYVFFFISFFVRLFHKINLLVPKVL